MVRGQRLWGMSVAPSRLNVGVVLPGLEPRQRGGLWVGWRSDTLVRVKTPVAMAIRIRRKQ